MAPTHATRLGSPPVGAVRVWSVLVGAWIGAVVGAACTFSIEPRISCGDGYVDEDAGEECDPGVPSSYEDACSSKGRILGKGACHAELCTIIDDTEQCAACGDGIVDEEAGEECDGDELDGQVCPSGKGTLQCRACRLDVSTCDACGDGMVDEEIGEECEPNPLDGITTDRPDCVDLPSPYPNLPFASGEPGPCTDKCRWNRITCSYCGNGQIDTNRLVDDDNNMAPPELCDGPTLNQTLLDDTLTTDPCTIEDSDLRSVVMCTDECTVERYDLCCVNGGKTCPADPRDCCYAQETEGFTPGEAACEQLIFNELFFDGCRFPETEPVREPGIED